MLTAILTNHLGWVATVAPIINSLPHNDHIVTIHRNQAKMSEISKFHPYNVLWAQLSDLHGSIGTPSRLAKTIVCGAQTITINKVLSILTYFVRCGEIQRAKGTKALDKNDIEDIIASKDYRNKVTFLNFNNARGADVEDVQAKKLSRTKTYQKNISVISNENLTNLTQQSDVFRTNELLPMNNSENLSNESTSTSTLASTSQSSINSTIQLMVTNPNNDRIEYETASEAIEFTLKKCEESTANCECNGIAQCNENEKIKNEQSNENKSCTSSLWSMDTVQEGISIKKWKTITHKTENLKLKNTELKRSQSLNNKANNVNQLHRSRTVRKIKANIKIDENKALNFYTSLSDLVDDKINDVHHNYKQCSIQEPVTNELSNIDDNRLKASGSVVFVLGDNEVLSGLKTPSPSPIPIIDEPSTINIETEKALPSTDMQLQPFSSELQQQSDVSKAFTSTLMNSSNVNNEHKKKKHCTHKKHSGVKFNFEQYPQIVTNYMKNKNLDITSYDFLEKGLKLEQENTFNYGASSTASVVPMVIPEDVQENDEHDEEEECECCANTFRILQTPSNATELEFSNDDGNYPAPIIKPLNRKLSVKSTTLNEDQTATNLATESNIDGCKLNRSKSNEKKEMKENDNENAIKSIKITNECLELITIPIPKTEFTNDMKNRYRIRAGYVPSLFVGVTDHYIPDMILQVCKK